MFWTLIIISVIVLIAEIVFLTLESKKRKRINYPYFRMDLKISYLVISITLAIDFIYLIVFREKVDMLTISLTTICIALSSFSLFIARKKMIIAGDELIKYNFLSKTKIMIKEIEQIQIGYFIKVKDINKKLIVLETKFYSNKDLANAFSALGKIVKEINGQGN